MTKLNSEALYKIFLDTMFKDEEVTDNQPPEGAIIVQGAMHKFGFHPERIKAHKAEIDAMLLELPDEFHQDKGGGWSFLNACMDRHGNLWGEHRNVEQLVCLGIAAGSASWIMFERRDLMPGGMPYIQVHVEQQNSTQEKNDER